MEPEMVVRPAFRLVGLEIRTRPMSPEIPALWPRFVARLPEIAGVTEPGVTWGAMRNEPDHVLVYGFYRRLGWLPTGKRDDFGDEVLELDTSDLAAANRHPRFQCP